MKKVFISYSWESDEHKERVRKVSEILESDGLEVTLDQWDLKPGDELALYMERAIAESDYVLIVCSETYKRKSDQRLGGSGYEARLMSAEIAMNQHIKKFIPITFGGDWIKIAPEFLKGNLYVDFSQTIGTKHFNDSYNDLLTTIFNLERKKPPKIDIKERLSERLGIPKEEIKFPVEVEEIKILGIITEEVTVPKNDGTIGSALYSIPFKLNTAPESLWCDLFIKSWNYPSRFTSMHRPGIASVIRDKIILNGTTIEEVKAYHRETLILAVAEANKKLKQQKRNDEIIEERRRHNEQSHLNNLSKHIDDIKF